MSTNTTEPAFILEFIHTPQTGSDPVARGRITIGSFNEGFLSPTTLWSPKNYIQHWITELGRFIHSDTEQEAILFTDMSDITTANFLIAWVLYMRDGKIKVQNELVFMDQVPNTFSMYNLKAAITPYSNMTDEGQPISEWETSLPALVECRARLVGMVEELS